MVAYSQIDFKHNPPRVEIPKEYNASADFIDRHLNNGNAGRTAIIDSSGSYSYAELASQVNRVGNALRTLGIEMESRIAMCVLDTIEFPATFWGAIKIGAVPVALNTLLTSTDYDYMLRDSRARVLVVSSALYEKFAPILAHQPYLKTVLVTGPDSHGQLNLAQLMIAASDELSAAPTCADDVAFWLYTSGSTGAPKGAMHIHSSLAYTAAFYGIRVLGIEADDVVLSAAKLFFAYGLGNAMTFPFYVGATAVLLAERPTPESIRRLLKQQQPTIFYGVPTLYAAMLADPDCTPENSSTRLRRCISAGEPLPEETARRWQERFNLPVLDGIGSTEMLHIFLSNSPSEQRYGSTGKAVPGYELSVVDENDQPLPAGEMGELLVKGSSSALAYWNKRDKSRNTFLGPWTRTGDKYIVDEDGFYCYCGRTDDMLKVSGQWVSPFDVEAALITHEKVLEAAVVGQEDENQLIKPKAYVILQNPAEASEQLSDELKYFVKQRLAAFKYPRWIEFVEQLPKTATGKIQRFKLR